MAGKSKLMVDLDTAEIVAGPLREELARVKVERDAFERVLTNAARQSMETSLNEEMDRRLKAR